MGAAGVLSGLRVVAGGAVGSGVLLAGTVGGTGTFVAEGTCTIVFVAGTGVVSGDSVLPAGSVANPVAMLPTVCVARGRTVEIKYCVGVPLGCSTTTVGVIATCSVLIASAISVALGCTAARAVPVGVALPGSPLPLWARIRAADNASTATNASATGKPRTGVPGTGARGMVRVCTGICVTGCASAASTASPVSADVEASTVSTGPTASSATCTGAKGSAVTCSRRSPHLAHTVCSLCRGASHRGQLRRLIVVSFIRGNSVVACLCSTFFAFRPAEQSQHGNLCGINQVNWI